MKSTASFNPVLSKMFNSFFVNPLGFIGLHLAPMFDTAEQAATYPVFPVGNFTDVPTLKQRAPGTPFQRSVPNISDDLYGCKNWGHETPVADENRKKYAKQIDADRAAMRRNAHVILFNHEIRVHTLFHSGSIASSSPATKWDDPASDPVADVKAVKQIIRAATGMVPNLLTIPETVKDKLSVHPKIRAIFPNYDGDIGVEQLRIAFGVASLKISGAIQNTAAEGQAASLADLWADDVVLSVSNPGQDLELPNAARTFHWTAAGESGGGDVGSFVETYRDDPIKSDVHRSLHHTDEKITGDGFAYMLTNVLTG
ncbi:MAG: major capsid protein [Rariglobus sp.]|jgi:hypothetical protein|nr:major capsid protein [Rariglobus sp.]